ncbi:decorin [Tribolium castaneum]|uniref:Connectin-like Protein n=1 Tax=Tribolium castaneum TaxID=7070 RepID=D6X4H9_TRICA|nr:PREDICTED: decorin [Tribolium castaneum]EEZ97559.1 Connectin-like Protein [Tribolium castaneum]|eukprot:XP_008198818.1 PREDICTED: decorin [Tribolium castaneum]
MARRVITRIVALLCFVVESEEKCKVVQKTSFCDSLQDLYRNGSLQERVIVEQKSGLEPFILLPNERAKDIKFLTINRAINNLANHVFKNFIHLERLILSYNELEALRDQQFQNQNLQLLQIYDCGVKTIEPLTNLPKLTKLRITHNKLAKIPTNIFSNLPLETLALSQNQITTIEKFAFANMTKLKKLFLDGNNLTGFNVPDYVTRPETLDRLWLHQNQLPELTNYMLEGLTNLKILNLGFNSISRIEPKTFEQTPKLENLVLTNNQLTSIDGAVLPATGLQNLKILYLDHNRLMFLSSNFLFRLNSLKAMSIGGNPWQCPCLDLVLRWLYDNEVGLKCDKDFFGGKRPVCVVPSRRNSDVCVYSYDQKSYDLFESGYKSYPSVDYCLL